MLYFFLQVLYFIQFISSILSFTLQQAYHPTLFLLLALVLYFVINNFLFASIGLHYSVLRGTITKVNVIELLLSALLNNVCYVYIFMALH